MKWLKPGKKVCSLVALLTSAIVVVLLAACGGTNAVSPTSNTQTQKNVILLKHSPAGTSELTWDPGSSRLNVKITLAGLAPNSSHAAHIHGGTCTKDGAVVYPLKPVVADARGDGSSDTTIENVRSGIPAQGWYINIHNGLLASPVQHRAISCGNINNSDPSKNKEQSVHVILADAVATNESVKGQAEFNTANGSSTLTITLNGLEPRSTHIAHIHEGSCEAQGPVVAMLKPVVADDQGNGTSVTTLDHMPTSNHGLYINVHTGAAATDLGQPTLFNPIACGNVAS
ncbi:MAG: hypothetical protein NVS2B12_40920 [Ktedonobacteraceae bacterium]